MKYLYWIMMYLCWKIEDVYDFFVPIEKQAPKQFYPSAMWEDKYQESM